MQEEFQRRLKRESTQKQHHVIVEDEFLSCSKVELGIVVATCFRVCFAGKAGAGKEGQKQAKAVGGVRERGQEIWAGQMTQPTLAQQARVPSAPVSSGS
jgi:hypothetical protein